jgi:hypothetical protein
MLDDYLKKLESLITPQTYSKQNYKSKFNLENNNEKNQIASEANNKLLDDYITKMGVKSNENIAEESRIRVYNKMLDSDDRFQSPPDEFNKTIRFDKVNRTQSMSPNHTNEKEKIHQLSIRNMNYRHEIETLKSSLARASKELEENKLLLNKLERQKDNDNKYLLKLEQMLENNKGHNGLTFSRKFSGGSMNDISKVSKKSHAANEYYSIDYKTNTLIIDDKYNDNSIAIADKEELKQYILSILTENRKLKEFQNQVFEISRNYDDINSTMLESIKSLQSTLNVDERLKFEEDGKMDLISNFYNLDNFDKILETIEKTLEVKNIEYNLLIDSRDQEIALINNELQNCNSVIANIKKDRIRDQKIINDLEIEVEFLKSQINDNNSTKINIINQIQQEAIIAEKMEKKVLPAKQSVQKTVKRIERTFDLQDKNNVKLLTTINKKLK